MTEDAPKLPTLALVWDAEAQRVRLQFDPADFRTWEFVIALLEMAKQAAEMNLRMAHAQAMQQAQAQRPVLPNGMPMSGLRG